MRNLKIRCRTWIAPRRAPALANGPKSFTPRSRGCAGDFDARKILARRDLQVRKRLVVFQLLVVLRLNVLDQPRFHQQGIDFAVAVDEVDVGDFLDPVGGAALGHRPFEEVAAGPAAQVLGLADVDHPAGGILHQIDAGRAGKFADLSGGPAEGGALVDRRRQPRPRAASSSASSMASSSTSGSDSDAASDGSSSSKSNSGEESVIRPFYRDRLEFDSTLRQILT